MGDMANMCGLHCDFVKLTHKRPPAVTVSLHIEPIAGLKTYTRAPGARNGYSRGVGPENSEQRTYQRGGLIGDAFPHIRYRHVPFDLSRTRRSWSLAQPDPVGPGGIILEHNSNLQLDSDTYATGDY